MTRLLLNLFEIFSRMEVTLNPNKILSFDTLSGLNVRKVKLVKNLTLKVIGFR